MLLDVILVLATVLCSLMAGFLFAFAVVLMPGIGNLDDREFILAFQETDGVIQRGHPLFGLMWIGSALTLGIGLALGLGGLAGVERMLLLAAAGLHFLGVQLPTMAVNIPLNNAIQRVEVATADEDSLRSARLVFEARWNRWNSIRTVLSVLCAAALAVLLLRL